MIGKYEQNDKKSFEKLVIKWARRPDPDEGLTFNQVASMVFGSGSSEKAGMIGRLMNKFREYFRLPDENKWKCYVNWDNIVRDYPQLLSSMEFNGDRRKKKSNPIMSMQKALSDEIRAVRQHFEESPIHVSNCKPVNIFSAGTLIYQAIVSHGDEKDVSIPVPEGVGILLKWTHAGKKQQMEAILLSYDPISQIIYFEVEQMIPAYLSTTSFKIIPRVDILLEAVKTRLDGFFLKENILAHRLLTRNLEPQITSDRTSSHPRQLDETQVSALCRCLTQDITFIWGPPGTGKTYTLAHLILEMAAKGKRILAVAVANVAVDQLAYQYIKALRKADPAYSQMLIDKQVIRFGHPRLPEVTGEEGLFPHKFEVQSLRKELHQLLEKQRKIPAHKAYNRALIQQDINALRSKIRQVIRQYICDTQIIFTTITQVCMEPSFTETYFDAVVVDEASMVTIPQLLCMAMCAGTQFVVGGDFRQLNPIALSLSQCAYTWLHRDGFEFLKLNQNRNLTSPLLAMLMHQRRMHVDICNLINKHFYDDKLKTVSESNTTCAREVEPLSNHAAVLIMFQESDGSEVKQTAGGSRRNERSGKFACNLAEYYVSKYPDFFVAIITPYRAQVNYIKNLLRSTELEESSAKRIRVGTVHAFQGSEADIVIWDTVETRHHTIGKLYRGDIGDRLANVAISRAKGKLIIVGDRAAFLHAPGTEAVGRLKNILQWRFSEEMGNIVKANDLQFLRTM